MLNQIGGPLDIDMQTAQRSIVHRGQEDTSDLSRNCQAVKCALKYTEDDKQQDQTCMNAFRRIWLCQWQSGEAVGMQLQLQCTPSARMPRHDPARLASWARSRIRFPFRPRQEHERQGQPCHTS